MPKSLSLELPIRNGSGFRSKTPMSSQPQCELPASPSLASSTRCQLSVTLDKLTDKSVGRDLPLIFPPRGFRVRPFEGRTDEASTVH